MKKLFVSVPMKGRTTEDIKKSISKMQKFAELIVGEELELIDSYVEDNPPKDSQESIWYLGKALEKLSEADVFIGITNNWVWKGCETEYNVARNYGIECYDVPPQYIIDDYNALERKINEERYSATECPSVNP